jgi:hypothetical protein
MCIILGVYATNDACTGLLQVAVLLPAVRHQARQAPALVPAPAQVPPATAAAHHHLLSGKFLTQWKPQTKAFLCWMSSG